MLYNPGSSNLTGIRGDTNRWILRLTRNKLPVDLTDCLFWFTVKSDADLADNAAMCQKTLGSGIEVVNALDGRLEVTLSPSDTASALGQPQRYYFDLQVKEANGDISTPIFGWLTFQKDATRTTS